MGGKSNAFLVWQQLFKALNVKLKYILDIFFENGVQDGL
jgi:hypothetical protein